MLFNAISYLLNINLVIMKKSNKYISEFIGKHKTIQNFNYMRLTSDRYTILFVYKILIC